ncbi:uncharacterized protein LOC131885306 [Tigriopus californicus]|uniref:uncharacterized protein LOC131885306 n=1 Tax=Tigriopus californicus TaxID=6832 RepID=UPI0027DA96CD|nr:uncharacterized protein LOC131885306 [Tigriopus californicus]
MNNLLVLVYMSPFLAPIHGVPSLLKVQSISQDSDNCAQKCQSTVSTQSCSELVLHEKSSCPICYRFFECNSTSCSRAFSRNEYLRICKSAEHHIRSKRRISVHTRHRRPCHVQSLAQSQSNGVSSCQADGIPCSQHPCCREVGQGTWQCGDTSAASTNRMMGREYWEDFSKSMNRMMSSIFNG